MDLKFTKDEQPTMENFNKRFVDIYNKEETLSPETKTLLGLGADDTPDVALALLSRFNDKLGQEYLWSRKVVTSGWEITKAPALNCTIYTTQSGVRTATVYYSDDVTVSSDGAISLAEPIMSATFSCSTTNNVTFTHTWPVDLTGKYFCIGTPTGTNLYYCTDGSRHDDTSEAIYKYYVIGQHLGSEYKTASTEPEYLNSPDEDAYPNGASGIYTYTALGQLGEKVRIATGSYTGTGTYGASNPNSLTFDFVPKLLLVGTNQGLTFTTQNGWSNSFIWQEGQIIVNVQASDKAIISISIENETIKWYCGTAGYPIAANQCNVSGSEYYYIAIG